MDQLIHRWRWGDPGRRTRWDQRLRSVVSCWRLRRTDLSQWLLRQVKLGQRLTWASPKFCRIRLKPKFCRVSLTRFQQSLPNLKFVEFSRLLPKFDWVEIGSNSTLLKIWSNSTLIVESALSEIRLSWYWPNFVRDDPDQNLANIKQDRDQNSAKSFPIQIRPHH